MDRLDGSSAATVVQTCLPQSVCWELQTHIQVILLVVLSSGTLDEIMGWGRSHDGTGGFIKKG